jgi:hypothetical protein
MAWTVGRLVATELDCAGDGGLEATDAAPNGGNGGPARASHGAVGRKRPVARLRLGRISTGGASKEEDGGCRRPAVTARVPSAGG